MEYWIWFFCWHLLFWVLICVVRYHSSSGKLKLTEELLLLCPHHVAAAYALNPLTIATCVAMSTGVFHNFVLSLVLLVILRGRFITSSLPARCYVVLAVVMCVSVRLSVHHKLLSEWLNVGSHKQCRTIAQGLLIMCCKRSLRNSAGFTLNGGANCWWGR